METPGVHVEHCEKLECNVVRDGVPTEVHTSGAKGFLVVLALCGAIGYAAYSGVLMEWVQKGVEMSKGLL